MRIFYSIILGLVSLFFVACDKPTGPKNSTPQIIEIKVNPSTATPGGEVSLLASATDPDGDQLNYHWTTTVGTFSNPDSQATILKVPLYPGTSIKVVLMVSDGKEAASKVKTIPTTATPQEIMTVMTYNILDGGGVGPTDPLGEWCCGPPPKGCCGAPGGNRLPRILQVIKAVDPDILGIQEAYLWQLDNHSIAQEVAAELGMKYFIGESKSPDGAHVVLFTKFNIKEAESYPGYFEAINPRGALHAEIISPRGQSIHLFVVHMKGQVSELSFLLEKMSPYLDIHTVLLGDMNFNDPSNFASMLREAGWCHPQPDYQGIDQIWTSPTLKHYVESAPSIPSGLTAGTSDHLPVAVKIGIYSPSGDGND